MGPKAGYGGFRNQGYLIGVLMIRESYYLGVYVGNRAVLGGSEVRRTPTIRLLNI